ncbi:coiled-coil domain-containing protein 39-like [Pollicipes pollicipes]|uniref:coiled-coil domain-containing protein 39-like n=1 Tax=Pollicipes pollicipes TaxID=41117 RepID=UPI001885760D|nr:coiled-coil domain-containing protein 39-like [Pollicipes pollicipes]
MENIQEILEEIGWDSSFRIPIANEECKKLEEEFMKKQQTVIAMKADIADQNSKSSFIETHLQNVLDEFNQNQSLMDARTKEIESENHLRSLAERESGRLKQDIKSMTNLMHDAKKRRIILEGDVVKLQESVDSLKKEMTFDREALEAWLRQMSERDDDIMALEHYARLDEGMIKDLNLKLERLNDEERNSSKKLKHATTDLMSVKVELDKLGEDYRRSHAERQTLLNQWEQTLQQIQKRERDIDKVTEQLEHLQATMNKRQVALEEQKRFLNAEDNNNHELELQTSQLERDCGKIREQYQRTEQEQAEFNRELEALKTNVSRVSMMLERARVTVHQLKNQFGDKNRAYIKLKMEKDNVDKALHEAREMAMSAEERAQRLARLLEEEENKQKLMDKELMRLKDLQFRKSNDLIKYQADETAKNAEIQGCLAARRNMMSKIRKMDAEVMKQQEIIYGQELLAQHLQKRIERMSGTRRDTERIRLEDRIKELKEDLEKRNQAKKFLDEQVKRTQEAQREVQRDLQNNRTLTDQFDSKESELKLHNECSLKELKRVVDRKQTAMVDDNMLRLTIKQLRRSLHAQVEQVFSLDQQRLDMDTAMKERRQEILAQKDLLKAELRALDEEIHKLGRDLTDRASKLDKMKKRYEVLLCSMGPVEEGTDASDSHILYVIKAAQEKEEVQREGDELDAKIKRTEAELVALENTCQVLKLNNESYRRNLSSPLETQEEQESAAYMQQLLQQTESQVKERRLQLLGLQEKVQAMQTELDELTEQKEALDRQKEELERQMALRKKELKEQEAKLDRASRFNNHVIKQLRKKTGHIQATREEQDIELRVRREEVRLAVRSLCDLTELEPDTKHLIVTSLEESGCSLPQSRASSAQSSQRSCSRDDLQSCLSMESFCSDSSGGTPASQRSLLKFPSQSSLSSQGSGSEVSAVASQAGSRSGSRMSMRSGPPTDKPSSHTSASTSKRDIRSVVSGSRAASQQSSQLSVVNIGFSGSSNTPDGSPTPSSGPSSALGSRKSVASSSSSSSYGKTKKKKK